MEKLGEIAIDNSFNVTVTCQVDQQLLARNFTTIINALKELQDKQIKTDSQLKDLSSLKERFDQLGAKVDRFEKTSHSTGPASNSGQGDFAAGDLDSLSKRVDRNESNIMDNIKDINLINKDLVDVKKLIEDLRNQVAHTNPQGAERGEKSGYGVTDIASNMSKQLQLSAEKMKELEVRLLKAEEQLSKHDQDIKDLFESREKSKGGQSTAPASKGDKDLEDFKRDLRDKLEIINRKIANLQSDSDSHDQDISEIKDILAQKEESKVQKEAEPSNPNPKSETNISKQDFNSLKRRLEEVDKRGVRDIKNLLEQLNNLKQLLSNQNQRMHSKSSLEEENPRTNRRSASQRDELNDKLNDLILKVNYLEKLISGTKSSLDDKNPEKLPTINRPVRKRDHNLTVYQGQEKSGISRKDLGELRAELEGWIKSLFDQNRERENFQGLELKIQEIKKSLQKKADAEGTKKGFAFLENKITQLYLFLTEPDTEDAMIVRKGFNCLSCSKRVEKLRGKIGPKLNWNNMTTTNYSPPKVGYSKPMGDSQIEKGDDM